MGKPSSNVSFLILISVVNLSLFTANMLSVIGKLYSSVLLENENKPLFASEKYLT